MHTKFEQQMPPPSPQSDRGLAKHSSVVATAAINTIVLAVVVVVPVAGVLVVVVEIVVMVAVVFVVLSASVTMIASPHANRPFPVSHLKPQHW